MRYYVTSIQYNKVAEAENRSVPFAFNDYNSALQKFYSILASDMANKTLSWSLVLMWDSNGSALKIEKWREPEQEVETA